MVWYAQQLKGVHVEHRYGSYKNEGARRYIYMNTESQFLFNKENKSTGGFSTLPFV